MAKKILFISGGVTEKLFDSGIAGGDVRLAKIMKGAIRKRLEVHLLVNSGGELFCQEFGLKGVTCHIFNFPDAKYSKFWHLWLTLKVFLTRPKGLEKFNEGIIYSANEMLWDVLPALRIKLRNRKNIKWAAIVHWMPPLKFWERKKATLINAFLFLISERIGLYLAYLFADKILCVSESTKRQLEMAHLKSKKILAVECGVDYKKLRKIAESVKEKKYDAIFMKRLQAVKGALDLPYIWQEVLKKKKNAKLLILSGGVRSDDGVKVKEVIKKLGIGKNVEFGGVIYDEKERFSILTQSRLFLLPTYEENWAIVIGEALACGVPVLCYDLRELREVWQDSILFAPVGNSYAMAQKALKLLNSPILSAKISEKGIKFVARYRWEAIAAKEMDLILE